MNPTTKVKNLRFITQREIKAVRVLLNRQLRLDDNRVLEIDKHFSSTSSLLKTCYIQERKPERR